MAGFCVFSGERCEVIMVIICVPSCLILRLESVAILGKVLTFVNRKDVVLC